MPRQSIAFSSNEARSLPLDAARLVNFFPEVPPLGSRAPALRVGANTPLKSVLYGTPGMSLSQTLGSGRARAAREALGYLWCLFGQTLYRIDSAGTAVACVGDTIPASGNAMMSDNGIQLAVLVGGLTYVVGSTNAIGSFTVSSGTAAAGTNKITSIAVNSVTVTGGSLDWSDSNEAFAGAIAASINAHSSSPEYTASTNGATVIIKASVAGTGSNGFGIVITVAGDVTVTPVSSSLSGGANSSTTVQQVTNSSYPAAGASSLDYIDGFGIWTTVPSGTTNRQFFISRPFDFTNLGALDFATAESTSSDLLRVLVNYREIWLFTKTGIEVWGNAGTSPFPFQRIPGAVMERGCAAALSPAKINGNVFWLGDDRKVYRAQAYQPQPISTRGIEDALRAASDVSDAVGITYSQGGHDFYVLTLPTLNRTFVWDNAEEGAWHERQTGTTLVPMAWLARWIVPAFGQTYAGLDAGKLCLLDMDTYTEAGSAIRRVAITPPFFNDGIRAQHSRIEIEMEVGVGISTGQGSDPEIMLRFSDDGGKSWSNERKKKIGQRGQRKKRVIFDRLGTFRQRAYEISISDPVKTAAYGLSFHGMGLSA